jgi:hypothetical protein
VSFLRPPPNRQRSAGTLPIPAPVGGLNARDSLAAMSPGDASVLTNLFPYADRVETRAGISLLSTNTLIQSDVTEGFTALASWSGGAAAPTLFGIYTWGDILVGFPKQVRIYLVNQSTGALTVSRNIVTPGSGDTAAHGEWTQFGSASGTEYLIIAATIRTGGVNTFSPQAYDGSSWSTLSITGVGSDTLGVHSHQNRLWFYCDPAKPLSAYYLPTGAVSGTVSEFNIAPFATKGGAIIAMRTWTVDGGTGGTDDIAVFFTTQGQAIAYRGTDPASLSTWSLVGVFDLGVPAAYNPNGFVGKISDAYTQARLKDSFAMKYGADLLFLMQSGLTSATRVLQGTAEGPDYTLSAKIRSLITQASADWITASSNNSDMPAMKMLYAPALRQFLISVPKSSVLRVISADVYAMNTESGAWAKFTGWNVGDMICIGSTVYITDGHLKIYKYDGTATSDAGTAITFECRQAYNYFNSPDNKLVTLMQPMLRATGNFSLTVKADTDFNAGTISSYTSYTIGSTQNVQPWLSPGTMGRAIAPHFRGRRRPAWCPGTRRTGPISPRGRSDVRLQGPARARHVGADRVGRQRRPHDGQRIACVHLGRHAHALQLHRHDHGERDRGDRHRVPIALHADRKYRPRRDRSGSRYCARGRRQDRWEGLSHEVRRHISRRQWEDALCGRRGEAFMNQPVFHYLPKSVSADTLVKSGGGFMKGFVVASG